MKKIILIMTLLLAVIISACGGQQGTDNHVADSTTAEQELQLKDCGDDIWCFRDATLTCEQARFEKTMESSAYKLRFIEEIRGEEGDYCITYLKYHTYDINEDATKGISDDPAVLEYLSEWDRLAEETAGKSMTCNVPRGFKGTMGGSVLIGSFSLDVFEMDKPCTGELKEVFNKLEELNKQYKGY
jgi:hypothetical protein